MTEQILVRADYARGDFWLSVDIELPSQGVSAIYGPSGCGKTTLLRIIAGLENAAQGIVRVKAENWQTDRVFVPTHRRKVGVVFQEASLLPHLSVRENLLYGRKRLTAAKDELWNQVVRWLDLQSLLHREVAQLSGGERQRVAFGRALLREPELLLLDEPMASLDAGRRGEILKIMQRLKSELDLPMILVSHDLREIAQIADHLVVMQRGEVVKSGNPFDLINGLLTRPDDLLPAFSLLAGKSIEVDPQFPLWRVRVGDELIHIPAQSDGAAPEIRLQVMAKDVSLSLSAARDSSILNIVPCQVEKIETFAELGQAMVYLQAKGFALKAQISTYSLQRLKLDKGKSVYAQIKAVSVLP